MMQSGGRRSPIWCGSSGRLAVAGLAVLVACIAAPIAMVSTPALALSEIQREDLPATPGSKSPDLSPSTTVPMPGPLQTPSTDDPGDEDGQPAETGRQDLDPDGPLPEVIYNLDRLPETVRRMHDKLIEAAKSGEVESLRPLLEPGDDGTQLSFGGVEGDPIDFIKGLSGDPDGQEILAIMEEVLSAGFVHLDAGQPNELYVWPYFFAMPLERLDNRQRVELFKIVTAGDYEDMKQFGTYIFYRLGIDPDGRWAFFVAGD